MISYLFIDGGYLREHYERQMSAFYGGLVPKIQYDVLASQLGGQRTYYYDAINYQQGQNESEADYQRRIQARQALHDHISSQTGYHVREGHVRKSSQKRKQEQKGVDVQLAVDALEHAARGNMRHAVIFSGDLDFEPLLTSLARLGVRTKLIYVPQTAAPELRNAADEIQKVTLQHFYQWAAPSFRANYRQVKLHYRAERPEQPVFEAVKVGSWHNRRVTLFRPTNQAEGRLYVEPGDELSEPSYLMEYPVTEDLPKAFELTFGAIEWEDTVERPL